MPDTTPKQFYLSKVVWLGVITTSIGALTLVADYLAQGDFSPASIVLLSVGVLNVILRVWFTDTAIAH